MAGSPRWFASLRPYGRGNLRGDLLAALTLAAIAIPEQLATARLVGVSPAGGLVAFGAGTLGFAALGANRVMSVGADSTIAPIMAAGLLALAVPGSAHYGGLVAVLALLTGVILLATRPLRLGFMGDLLSVPVTLGFLAGVALHISIGQLPAILGFHPLSGDLESILTAAVRALPHANVFALAIGFGVFLGSFVADKLRLPLPAPLLGLMLAAGAVALWHLDARGVAVIGALSLAPPHVALVWPGWDEFVALLPLALILALVCMMQTAAVRQSYPNRGDGGISEAARDFAAVGLGSVIAGLLGSFAVNASPPRTAAVVQAGGRSQLAGLLAVGLMALALLLAGRWFVFVPQAGLAGVLIFIATRLLHIGTMRQIWAQSRPEMLLLLAATLLVVALPIETGVGMAIMLSLLHSIYVIARPLCAELARLPGTTIWWRPEAQSGSEYVPGVLVFALGAPVSFVNAHYLVEKLRAAVGGKPGCRLVVIEANGVIDIDFTGARILGQAIGELRAAGIDVAIARLESARAAEAAERTGLAAQLGAGHLFRSVEEAVRGLES